MTRPFLQSTAPWQLLPAPVLLVACLVLPVSPVQARLSLIEEVPGGVVIEWAPESSGAIDLARVALPPGSQLVLVDSEAPLPSEALKTGEPSWFRRVAFRSIALDPAAARDRAPRRLHFEFEGARALPAACVGVDGDEAVLLRSLVLNPATASCLAALAIGDASLRAPAPLESPRGLLRRRPLPRSHGLTASSGELGFPGSADDESARDGLQGGRVKISVGRDAIYRITWSMLDALGVDLAGVRIADLHLLMKGSAASAAPVAILTEDRDADALFGPGDSFVFWGKALTDDYQPGRFQGADTSDVNAYFLDTLVGDWAMRSRDATPDVRTPLATTFTSTAHAERNAWFKANSATGLYGVDHFYWCPTMLWTGGAPRERVEDVPLTGLATGAGPGVLRVRMLAGASLPTVTPDHHVVLLANGTTVSDETSDGFIVLDQDGDVPAASLVDPLPVTIRIDGTAGVTADRFELDYIEVDYPRTLAADADQLAFTLTGGQRAMVTGLDQPDNFVLDVSDSWSPERLEGVVPGANSVTFQMLDVVPPARHAVASLPAGAEGLTPTSLEWVPDSGLRDPSLAVDLLLVGPKAWLATPSATLTEYIALRESEGLRVLAVPIEAATDEFGGGIFGYSAVYSFLESIVATWSEPPRWCLLLGDTSADYKGMLEGQNLKPSDCLPFVDDCDPDEADSIQFVPTRIIDNPTDQILGYYASDVRMSMVAGGDDVPDVTLGRIPVRSAEALDDVLRKIIRYDALRTAPPAWASRVIFSADAFRSSGEDVFELAQNEARDAYVQPPYTSAHYYFESDYGATNPTAFTADFTSDWADPARGAGVASYVGHGNTFRWSSDALLINHDALSCRNDTTLVSGPAASMPVLLNANCISGGFMHLQEPALLEALMRTPEGGAIACFGPTGITDAGVARTIINAFYSGTHGPQGRGLRLGDIIFNVQLSLTGSSQEELYSNVLLGDPSLELVVPHGPAALTLRAMGGDTRVDLDWDAVAGADGYKLFRGSTSTGPWTPLGTVDGATFALTDIDDAGTPVVNGVLYWYVLEPQSSGWPGRWSSPASARPCTAVPPNAPGAINANPGAQPGSFLVLWGASPTPSLQGYILRIYRGPTATGTPVRTIQSTGTAHSASGLVPCTEYTFDVHALSWCNVESVAGSSTTRIAQPCPLALDVPSFIEDLMLVRSGNDIVLDWSPVTRTIQGARFTPTNYVVHRADRADFLASAATLAASPAGTGFTDVSRIGNGANLEFWAVAAVNGTRGQGGLAHDLPQGTGAITVLDLGGGTSRLTWSPVLFDIQGERTPITSYEVFGSATPFTRLDCEPPALPLLTVTAPTADVPQAAGPNWFVVPVDVHGNRSAF